MATVVEHVRARAHRSTRTSPLPTPSLSRLVYVDFHALPGPRTPRGCLLREVAQASSIQSWYRYSLASHADRPLLETAGASGRFGGLRVRDAVTRIGASPPSPSSAQSPLPTRPMIVSCSSAGRRQAQSGGRRMPASVLIFRRIHNGGPRTTWRMLPHGPMGHSPLSVTQRARTSRNMRRRL